MTKETVMVHVCGSPFGVAAGELEVYRGPDTHMRSEGTWLLGVALNMARHGHPTTIIEYPWGDQTKYPLPQNITLQKEFQGECDIFIDVGWDETYAVQRYSNIKARHYVHGWGGDPHGSTFEKYMTDRGIKNHYMARTSRCFQELFKTFPYSVYMPTPLTQKIPLKPNFHSEKMLWANRGAFNRGYAPNSLQILHFMEQHPRYYYTVLLFGDIAEKAREIGMFDEVVTRFNALPKARLDVPYTGLPHDEFIKELSESKMLLTNGQPSAHPQTLEAVCYGCVPLLWPYEHHFQTLGGIPINKWFKIEGVDRISEILEDEEAFTEYYQALATVTVDHEYDNAYDIFMYQLRRKEA